MFVGELGDAMCSGTSLTFQLILSYIMFTVGECHSHSFSLLLLLLPRVLTLFQEKQFMMKTPREE